MISLHTSLAAFFVRLAVQLLPKRQRPVVMNTAHGYLFDDSTPCSNARYCSAPSA
ncbi:MAG: hypothetical protein ACLRIO_04055 [Butyricicoccus sp.]